MLTACGIETCNKFANAKDSFSLVATVLTACGIETVYHETVSSLHAAFMLQQCLPLAVLKQHVYVLNQLILWPVATVLTACGIETGI